MAGWQRPTGLKDWARVASGVSLVFDELLLQSPAIGRLRAGDIVGSTTETLNYVRNSVADLTGLTKGRLRSHSDPYHPHAHQVQSHVSSKGESEPLESSRSNVVDKSQSSESLKGTPQPEALFRPSSTSGVDDHRLDGRASEDAENGVPNLKTEVYGANCISGRDSFFPEGQTAVSSNGRNRTDLGSTEPPADEGARDRVAAEPPSRAKQGNAGGAVGGEVRENKAEVTAEPRPLLNKRKARERRVPSSPLGRAMGFAGLGAGLAWGTVQESAKRLWGGRGSIPAGQSVLSPFMNEQNAERLALAFCRMRGAALKVGQMLSIQDESLVPPPVLAALESVRQGADVMPRKQMNKVTDTELGPGWKERISSFDDEPMAAASIGQVHRAVLKDGRNVVMKIQYPGVAASIDSDIDNVRLLLDYTNLIPKGLYLDQAMRVAKEELRRECDYLQEAENQKRYRGFLQDDAELYVPLVIDEFTTKGVLTSELVPGVSIDKVAQMDQKVRNRIGTKLLELTLRELFLFRFMQTDPNWGNFLYDESTKIINLIDFGAARGYSEQFVDDYLRMVLACANRDRGQIIEMSIRLGFLTGTEEPVMLDAHVEAAYATGEPFSKPGGFDFRNSNLPRRISELGSTMLRYRVTAPPDEAYSLHRKLSGAFLACVKLRAVVPCRDVLLNICERPRPGEAPAEDMDSSFSGKAASA